MRLAVFLGFKKFRYHSLYLLSRAREVVAVMADTYCGNDNEEVGSIDLHLTRSLELVEIAPTNTPAMMRSGNDS